ncbi:Similar to HSDL2: Hydroxysteroid dehydrogenase-like protein 2 (Bos taurus) [Cotesia congregata]|uniref:Hydroxysteroid dehydrogenase-like protein 2 n=1 Tax=Cotesia congregata TaxID=51543 RepID=A0A8J2H397_COTCN|nr:Similar to HSDL2: Hydroxysteroid dehydrogenase-like protein 2 (Bos taurus) [Cotesia congregata]
MISNTGKLAGRTLFITGASRGIGKSIALKAAKDVEEAGGKALPCMVDVRDESQVLAAVNEAVSKFGGIDIVVNNASAISLTPTLDTDMKRYDLMNNVNTRGTFLVSKACIPFLKKSSNPHILNLSPPLSMKPKWFQSNLAYTLSKYGMSMCAMGMAEEFKNDRIAVNALWPKTAIHTAAIEMLTGGEGFNVSRKADIMADAAYLMLDFFLDEEDFQSKSHTVFDPTKKPAQNSKDLNVIFSAIRANLSADLVRRTTAIYQFNITGDNPGTWVLDLKTGNGALEKGKPSQAADAVLTMEANNFFDMFSGKLKPATAFMMGKLKIDGNLQVAMKLEKLMSSLKSKL